jgi:hypothetical protein
MLIISKYTIYILCNTINDKKYVGCTKRSLKERLNCHKNESKKDRAKNRKLYRAMNEIGFENFYIKELESVITDDKGFAYKLEIKWIKKLNSVEDGYNESYGGRGKLLYPIHIQRKIYERYLELKSVLAVSKEFNCDVETVEKSLLRNGLKKSKILENQKIGNRERYGKMVSCFNKNWEYIDTFETITDGIKFAKLQENLPFDENHICSAHVSDVCYGIRKSAYGFKWKWTDHTINK